MVTYLLGNSLGQIFGSLSFTSSCGALWRTPKVEMEGSKQSSVASVSERSDDKTAAVSCSHRVTVN